MMGRFAMCLVMSFVACWEVSGASRTIFMNRLGTGMEKESSVVILIDCAELQVFFEGPPFRLWIRLF
jgi:hypothetical protein